jgi:hypothetical protein
MIASMHVEWVQPSEFGDYDTPEDWLPELALVPFAQNGAGDLWCVHPTERDGERVPIALVPHDELKATIYAPDFEAFLFRQLLEALTEIDPSHDKRTPDQRREHVKAEIRTLTPYVRVPWIALLTEVASRPVTTTKHGYHSFLSRRDASHLVKETLAYARLDATFPYSTDS